MKIFVVRHGQTVWNSKGITQGRTNNRLSKVGIEQAEKSAIKLKQANVDMIFCSPLCRTVQTANIFNKVCNVKIIKDERLIEIEQGIFTGKKYSTLTEQEKIRKNLRLQEDGVESNSQVLERVKDFIEFLKNKYYNKTVLIVTHNVVASLIECYINNGDKIDTSARMNNFGNAEIKEFDF